MQVPTPKSSLPLGVNRAAHFVDTPALSQKSDSSLRRSLSGVSVRLGLISHTIKSEQARPDVDLDTFAFTSSRFLLSEKGSYAVSSHCFYIKELALAVAAKVNELLCSFR